MEGKRTLRKRERKTRKKGQETRGKKEKEWIDFNHHKTLSKPSCPNIREKFNIAVDNGIPVVSG